MGVKNPGVNNPGVNNLGLNNLWLNNPGDDFSFVMGMKNPG